jgi:hypothetical protein
MAPTTGPAYQQILNKELTMPLGAFRLNGLAKRRTIASSRTAVTVTAVGNAQVDTAQSKFGGASGLFDGTSGYLTSPHSNNWDLIEQLHSNIKNSDFDDKEYDSVGFCLYKFKK